MTCIKQYRWKISVFFGMNNFLVILSMLITFVVTSQTERPKNYRRFDEKLIHFGFMLGINSSDFTAYTKLDAYEQYGLTGFETKAQPGGQVGIVTTMKVGTPVVRLRFLPSLSFQERVVNLYFQDNEDPEKEIKNEERMNATSLDFPLMWQFRTTRLNNFASYVLIGGQYSVDLQSQQDATQSFIDPFLKMKKNDWLGQVGVGLEFFAPYFKFGVEVKYSHSFMDGFIQDNTAVSRPINKMYNRGWLLSFIFEG